jgi:hypothetical protein
MKEEFYPGGNNEAVPKQSVEGKTLKEKLKYYEEKAKHDRELREAVDWGFDRPSKASEEELEDQKKIDALQAELGIENSGQDKETQDDDLYKMNLSDIDKMDLKDIDKMLKKDSKTTPDTIRAESGVKGSEQNKETQEKEGTDEDLDEMMNDFKKITEGLGKLSERNDYRKNDPYIKKDYDNPKKEGGERLFRNFRG